jgi:hypothetical protein
MPRIEDHIDIATSPSAVFRFCHDIAKRPEWDERIVRLELISPAPIRKGTLIQVDEGRRGTFLYSWEGEYEAFQFPSGSTVRVLDAAPSSPFRAGREEWQFNAVGGSTRFTLVWEYTTRHFVASILDSLVRRASTRRAIRHSLANLKTMLEGG